jgi:hypothetical protein
MRELKEALLKEYGSFADKRIKNIDKGTNFIVDDRKSNDYGANKDLYGWFCMVFAEVESADAVKVHLSRSIPSGAPVRAWSKKTGIVGDENNLSFTVTKQTLGLLTELAAAFRAIVAPGAPRYSTASYKYSCPRTAGSLERLAKTLARAWKL